MIDNLNFFFFRPVHCRQVGQDLELEARIVAQESANVYDAGGIDEKKWLKNVRLQVLHTAGELFIESSVYLLGVHATVEPPPRPGETVSPTSARASSCPGSGAGPQLTLRDAAGTRGHRHPREQFCRRLYILNRQAGTIRRNSSSSPWKSHTWGPASDRKAAWCAWPFCR